MPPRTSSGRANRSSRSRPLPANLRRGRRAAALVAAVVLVGLTFLVIDPVANAALYAVVQVLLVAVAAVDLETRRIPNELVAGLAVLALVARAISERSHLVESAVAGVAVFSVALLLATIAKGGLGMGDVKLAGALGFVLGTLAGAAAGLAVIARRGRAGRGTTIAYGPYLALGGALGILLFGPPPLG